LEPYRGKLEKIHTSQPLGVTAADAHRGLRAAAIAADDSSMAEINLSLLWRELARGTSVVEDGFFADKRCYLVLSLKTDGHATPLEGRRLEILEAVLGGMRQKNIAIDMQLAPSTVALNSRLALESLGVACKPSRAHPLLMLAAKAISEPTLALGRYSTFVTGGDRELRVVSVPRPDIRLHGFLPPAELSVIRSLIEGLSYQEIAQLRSTSTRTVANQITAVFRRLRVSGRNELVQRLFLDEAQSKPLAQASAETLVPPDTGRATPMPRLDGARRSA
jgi:DNA-binding NarL/FixJ family response regulator